MRVSILTYGCKLNQYETELMTERLENIGFVVMTEEVESDVFILNSCVVTNEATRKIRQEIRKLKRKYPESKIIVAGCYSQLSADEILKEGVDLVVGNGEKRKIDEYIGRTGVYVDKAYWKDGNGIEEETIYAAISDRTRAFVKVEDGCNNVCTYCAIRLARGVKVRSKPVEFVVTEVRRLIKRNYKEIVITGLNLGKYGLERGYNLLDLLEELVKIEGDFRIRLSSINPEDITDKLIDFIINEIKICNHLHIPLQSASDRILEKMNRNYRQRNYIEIVNKLRKKDPIFSITTDIMVGFPGETEKDFYETLKVVEDLRFSKVHAFRYSPKKGTLASTFTDQIPGNIKKERLIKLEQLSKKMAKEYRKNLVGAKLKVLVEGAKNGIYRGYDEYYVLHEIPKGSFGNFEDVIVFSVTEEGVVSKSVRKQVSNR
ncbi:tRNA (N(6)-L-threonylcarbamoyladenosine(37)-C(2))-methylthiotransferase MtaB [Thermosipho ferrireducens]|uniref:tRNA (N(6)-L-threonylcarbamoyladenosine(37)-C(2))-methylthiotransferase MtaB n=1 Tax=Thermosipho ferrireducens TaxID=2571116 RepID=A0ABX7S8Q8_9BACT|nr:tRNA (N(6)-L-threonylcarbamoyladenosine(37)-C(2))-methylthiotransferase MtaB [Thermosipho ferrireducens]QTA38288.1 tRNA (N(6)-L-threonylcarbamoyladenosine(37)-C(2))-methylthiotransferase MtaB [Thermosipho ferrireducens]